MLNQLAAFTAGYRTQTAVLIAVLIVAAIARAQEPAPGFRAYSLRHASASELAGRVREALADTGAAAQVFVDAETNRLLISGSEESQKLAGQLLRTLDQPATAANPGQTASRATEAKGYRTDDPQQLARQLQEKFRGTSGTRIVVDERTRQVIVVATPDVHDEIRQLVENHQGNPLPTSTKAAKPIVTPRADSNDYQLQRLSASDLEDELRRYWGNQIEITENRSGDLATVSVSGPLGSKQMLQIDRSADRVAFFGNQLTMRTWRKFVEAVDAPRDGADSATKLVSLQNADPAKVQAAISLVQPAAKANGNGEYTATVKVGAAKARQRTGGDLVSMIFQQGEHAGNQPAAPAGAGQADAAPAGDDQGGDGEDGGLIGPVSVEILDPLGIIILKGNKRDVAKVQKIIEDIDRISAVTQPEVEIIHLNYLNSEAVTSLVTELYTEILSPRQGQVSIRALVEPNSVLLIGRKESLDVVKQLIQKLDQPSPPSSQFEVFRLKFVSAIDAETTIRNFFVTRPGFETNVRTALGARVQVIGDFRTNSLIVQASPRDMAEVRRLIESIDVADTETAAQLRIFKLKNALAADLAAVLQAAITGQQGTTGQQGGGQPGVQQPAGGGQGGGGTTTATQSRVPSTGLELMTIDQTGGKILRSGILADVVVTADPSINALVVRAPSKSMELIAALIDQLDRLPDAQAQVKVFTIVNGNAVSLTTTLQQLFGQTATGTAGGLNQGLLNFGLNQQLQAATAGGDTSLVPLRFAVDQRTNSIIASGTEGDLAVVETILVRLDENLEDRRLTVVRLRNTQADSVALALQQYLQNLQQQVNQQLLTNQAVTAFEQVERQVIVTPEPITNSIIVSATPRYQEEILKVIEELDVRRPLVLIQVLIAEVKLSNIYEFGAEFGLQDSLVFDRGKAVGAGADAPSSPGFNFGGYPNPNISSRGQEVLAGQALSTFGLGRTSPTAGFGGLVLSAANESINILLRALEQDGRVQILSRPQLMTMHNEPAEVQVGANVARITGSNITQFGVTQNVNDVPTGLILRVLPLINDDDVVVMGIEASRSALGSEAEGTVVSISTDGTVIRQPPINITSAQATISARSGQTVVFAGLIQKEKTIQLNRVPYLSDVPVLGRFFEFESNRDARNELLVIMTPYIIRGDADLEGFKLQESARMSWCMSDVVGVTGDWGLIGDNCAFCTKKSPLIFPDCDPTGMQYVAPYEPQPAVGPVPPLEDHGHVEFGTRPIPASAERELTPPQPIPESAMLRRVPAPARPAPGVTNDSVMPASNVSPAAYEGVIRLPTPTQE